MAFVETLNNYIAFLYPSNGKRRGRINLYWSTNRLYLRFVDPSDSIPFNNYNANIKAGEAFQPIAAYPDYIDLLRNEKPISVTFRPEDNPPTYVIYTGSEPPGDGEL